MSASFEKGRGGTFCRFTVGSREKGASARHLRYISNTRAVQDGKEGIWLKAFPAPLLDAPYGVIVRQLCHTARQLEQDDIIGRKSIRQCRTHYQVILGFEVPLDARQAKSLLSEWMQTVFPDVQSVAFLHRNTQHLHIQVWIAARQTDGKKINLSARAFRQLDEQWNTIYSRAMKRDEREHLLKKGQTERYKQLWREGKGRGIERPKRAGHSWKKELFNERERERLGGRDDHHQKGAGRDKRTITAAASGRTDPTRRTASGEPLLTTAAAEVQETLEEAQRAVSETARLHRDAARVAEQEQSPALEPEQER